MRKRAILFFLLNLALTLISTLGSISAVSASAPLGSNPPPLQTVPFVDVQRYLGTWFQISRVILPFEGDCACAQQTNSKFTVDFGIPQKGQYWIVALGTNYEYAVVSDPDRKSLYVLSKTPELDPVMYQEALNKASSQLDTGGLVPTSQKGCSYPPEVVVPDSVVFETESTPTAPLDPAHPGSKSYPYTSTRHTVKCLGRETDVFLSSKKAPLALVAFGHGQALDTSHYEGTHEHLAKKGFASLNPPYDTGFFDRDWHRMGADYTKIVECVANAFPGQIDRTKVIYSGHSKGAYVAQIAAGIAHKGKVDSAPRALLLFNPAGHDAKTLKDIGPATATTVVFSDQDNVVKRSDSEAIFNQTGSTKRQFLILKSYSGAPVAKADHFWSLTRPSTFGGGAESALHYYGSWKWLTAAAEDLESGGSFSSRYLYGVEAADKGMGSSLRDDRFANF